MVAEFGAGYAFGPSEAAPLTCWDEVVNRLIERSHDWVAETGLDATVESALVQRRFDELRPMLREV